MTPAFVQFGFTGSGRHMVKKRGVEQQVVDDTDASDDLHEHRPSEDAVGRVRSRPRP